MRAFIHVDANGIIDHDFTIEATPAVEAQKAATILALPGHIEVTAFANRDTLRANRIYNAVLKTASDQPVPAIDPVLDALLKKDPALMTVGDLFTILRKRGLV